jgi:hypothetical protein
MSNLATKVRTTRHSTNIEKTRALNALKRAVFDGSVWQYEHLVAVAVGAGVRDREIDDAVHEALHELFDVAEEPLTPRNLANSWPLVQCR